MWNSQKVWCCSLYSIKHKETEMPSTKTGVAAQEAEHGEKMIEIKLRFWTNDIAKQKGKIVPKNAWAAGVVRVERNDSHGIKTPDCF